MTVTVPLLGRVTVDWFTKSDIYPQSYAAGPPCHPFLVAFDSQHT